MQAGEGRCLAGVAETLTEAELVRARNQIKAGTPMALESSGPRCEQAARHLLIHGRPIQGKLTLAALGPIEDLEPLDKIAARFAA